VRIVALWVVCAFGCGRVAFDHERRAPDDTPTTIDGGVDCWAAWRSGAPSFGAVAPISELADPDKQGNPWLAADGRTLYFDSGTGDTEIYRATRAGPGQPFGPRMHVAELVSPLEDTGFTITTDDRVAVFASTRAGSAGFDLWQTDRAGSSTTFNAPTSAPFAAINDAANQFDAFLSSDGLRIYYAASTMTGQVLRMSSRASTTAAFAAPVPIPGSGTLAVEADPELSPDELVMVLSANVPLQLHVAVRSSTTASFGPPIRLSAIVGAGYDGDPTLSPDGCELLFISDRGGDRDLYRTTVIP
jgi:hypothetical protein